MTRNFTTSQGATDGSKVNVRQQEVGHNLNDLNFDASGQDCNSKSPLLETAKKEIDKIFQDMKEKSKAKNENSGQRRFHITQRKRQKRL